MDHSLDAGYAFARKLFSLNVRDAQTIESLEAFRQLDDIQKALSFVPDPVIHQIETVAEEDPLVDLETFLQENASKISLASGATNYGSDGSRLQMRRNAAQLLLTAQDKLESLAGSTVALCVTDAYRPLALQRAHFVTIRAEIAKRENLTGEALYQKTLAVIADPDLSPPHCSGGAIDLTLLDLKSEKLLDMGTLVDEVHDPKIITFHADLTFEQQHNRALLFAAMTSAGFVNFPGEWWHYSYGEKEWALRSGTRAAIYKTL